jgi:hypothetical protein
MSLNEGVAVPTDDQMAFFNQKVGQLRQQRNEARENLEQLDIELYREHQVTRNLRKDLDQAVERIDELTTQLQKSQVQVKDQAEKIEELEEIIVKQKRTIKVQSDQISDTRETNNPRRVGQITRPTIFDQPPPIYNQPQPIPSYHPQPAPGYQPQPISSYQPHPAPGYLRQVSAEGSPSGSRSIGDLSTPSRSQSGQSQPRAAHMPSTPSHGTQTPSVHSPYGSTPSVPGTPNVYRPSYFPESRSASRNTSGASQEGRREGMSSRPTASGLARAMGTVPLQDEDEVEEIPWPAEFSQFFKLTEDWARNYANVPNQYHDKHMPEELLASMKRQASEDLVMTLLGSGATRYFLIARAMNTWIINDIFRAQCFLNYWPEFDQKLLQYRQGHQDWPIHVRASRLIEVAQSAKQMQARPGFEQFLSSLITEKVHGVWERLQPLLAPGVLNSQAFDDTVHLIREALRVGLLMITTPLVYRIDFPKSSPPTYFSPTAMINRDPELRGDPLTLLRECAVVRLGITPVIVITSFAGSSSMPRTVHYANVLLRSYHDASFR